MIKFVGSLLESNVSRIAKILVPSWVILNIDIFLSLLGILISYLLRFNFTIPVSVFENISGVILFYLGIRVAAFVVFGTDKMYIRYTGIKDLIRIVITVFVGNTLFVFVNVGYAYFYGLHMIPLSVILIDFFITSYLLIAFRIFAKHFIHSVQQSGEVKRNVNVIIYGREYFAVSLKRALDSDQESTLKIVGFMHHSPKAYRKTIEGLSIFDVSELEGLIAAYSVKQLIFADNNIPADQKNLVVQTCLNNKVKVKSIKNFIELTSDSTISPKLDEIKIAETMVKIAISDGLNAGLDYKDIYKLCKERVSAIAKTLLQ